MANCIATNVDSYLNMGVRCSVEGCGNGMGAYVLLLCEHCLCWEHSCSTRSKSQMAYCVKCFDYKGVSKLREHSLEQCVLNCGCQITSANDFHVNMSIDEDCINEIEITCRSKHVQKANDIPLYYAEGVRQLMLTALKQELQIHSSLIINLSKFSVVQ